MPGFRRFLHAPKNIGGIMSHSNWHFLEFCHSLCIQNASCMPVYMQCCGHCRRNAVGASEVCLIVKYQCSTNYWVTLHLVCGSSVNGDGLLGACFCAFVIDVSRGYLYRLVNFLQFFYIRGKFFLNLLCVAAVRRYIGLWLTTTTPTRCFANNCNCVTVLRNTL